MRHYVIGIVPTRDPLRVVKKRARNEHGMPWTQKPATPLPKRSLSQVAKYITTQVKETHRLVVSISSWWACCAPARNQKVFNSCSITGFQHGFGAGHCQNLHLPPHSSSPKMRSVDCTYDVLWNTLKTDCELLRYHSDHALPSFDKMYYQTSILQ